MIECREVAKILGNSERLDLMLMREFLKSEDDLEDSKFNFNSSPKSPKQRATKWENVLRSLRDTFNVERGMYDVKVLKEWSAKFGESVIGFVQNLINQI